MFLPLPEQFLLPGASHWKGMEPFVKRQQIPKKEFFHKPDKTNLYVMVGSKFDISIVIENWYQFLKMVLVPVLSVIQLQYFWRFCLMFDANIHHHTQWQDRRCIAKKILVSRILFKLSGWKSCSWVLKWTGQCALLDAENVPWQSVWCGRASSFINSCLLKDADMLQ